MSKKEAKVRKPKKDRGIGKFFLALLTAIILFIVLLVVQSGVMNKYEKVSVVVAKDDIAISTDITEDNLSSYFTTVDYDVTKVPAGYIAGADMKDKLANSIVTAALPKGQVVTESAIVSNDSVTADLLALADGDLIETSFSTDSISDAVAGTLRRGDVVTIIIYDAGVQTEAEADLYVEKYVLEDIHIKQAYDGSGVAVEDTDSTTAATMFDIVADQDSVDTLNELLLRKSSGSRVRMTIVKTNDVAF